MVKNPSAIKKAPVWSLGLEEPLQGEMATPSSILAWEIPWTAELMDYSPWGCKRVITSKNKKQTNKKTLSFCIYKRESQGFIKYLEHHTEGWAQEIKPMKLCMKHWIHPNFHMHWYYLNNHNKYCDNWPTSMTEGEHRWCETRADLKINEKNMKNKLILKSQPIERW